MKHEILSHLPGDIPWQVQYYDTIDSTNDRAKALAAQGAPHGTVLIADQQTGGRGRMGRSFSSPAGLGIYLSVLLRPKCHARDMMHLTCAAAVAMCDAVQKTTGFRPGVKWINDLIADGKKLGGILTELSVTPDSGQASHAIVGIGINCCQKPADFPEDIRDIAVSLETATGQKIDRHRLAAAMINALWEMDGKLLTQKASVMEAYAKDCITLGKEVILHRNEQTFCGTAMNIDPDGGLLIRLTDGTVQTVNSGEVSVRGMYGYV